MRFPKPVLTPTRCLRFSPAALAVASVALLILAASPRVVHAQQVVAPNILATMDSAASGSVILLRQTGLTYQTQIAASQLTAFSTGSQIGSFSVRLDTTTNATAPASDLTFANFNVTISQAARQMAGSTASNPFILDSTFANNVKTGTAATVYNRALTLAKANFSSGATGTTPNLFSTTITFDTPYAYQGGDLLITIRHGGNQQAASVTLDATNDTAEGYGTAITTRIGSGEAATTTLTSTTTLATVLRLNGIGASATPEPGTLPLVGMGLATGAGMVGTIKRRKAKQQLA